MDAAAIATWWTIPAIVTGPVVAVLITRYFDLWRYKRERRLDVFRTLMRTRRMKLHADHVGALNLVRVEFDKAKKVIQALDSYMLTLDKKLAPSASSAEIDDFGRERDRHLTKLLHEISVCLRYKIEQLEILEGGYVPQGWQDEYDQQRSTQFYLQQIVSGQRALPISFHWVQPPGSPFPPPPGPTPQQPRLPPPSAHDTKPPR